MTWRPNTTHSDTAGHQYRGCHRARGRVVCCAFRRAAKPGNDGALHKLIMKPAVRRHRCRDDKGEPIAGCRSAITATRQP